MQALSTCGATVNEGQSWERISPDLTRADPTTLGDSGGPITKDQNGPEFFATIFTIAPSRFDKGTLFVGSDDGRVHVTRDGGRTWADVTPPDMPDFTTVSMIDASPHVPGAAYAAGKRCRLDDQGDVLVELEPPFDLLELEQEAEAQLAAKQAEYDRL